MKPSQLSQTGRAIRGRLAITLCTALWLPALAGVTSYGFVKGANKAQINPTTIVDSTDGNPYGVYAFVHTEGPDDVFIAQIQAPGKPIPIIPGSNDDPTHLEYNQEYESKAALDADAPNGTYSFQILDSGFVTLNASLNLSGDAYPVGSPILNYAAAQAVNAAQPFTIQWTPPAGLGANDYVLVSVWNNEDNLHESPQPWSPDALPGTTASYTIPAGTLHGNEIQANVIFIKVTQRNTASIAGATGLTGYFTSVSLPVRLAGGGDTTKPTLAGFTPANLAQVEPTTPLVLTFSEAMQPVQEVMWINLPGANTITYSWSNGGQTLACSMPGGFPDGATILWGLNAAGFKDLAGNTLSGQGLGGTFSIKKTAVEPCANGPGERQNFFFVLKNVSYAQASPADPVESGDPVAQFGAFFAPVAGTTVSAASVKLPDGSTRNLTGVAGRYFSMASAGSESALNATYPAGNYTGSVTIGGQAGNVVLGMPAAPPIPKCANYAAAQAVDPKAAFTLQWNAFTGATGNDRVEILVTDDTGMTVFQAPNECANPAVPLPNTATSVTLPQDLLAAGKTYNVQLSFMKIGTITASGSPAFQGAAGYSHATQFTLKTTGGTVTGPVTILAYRLPADGHFEVDAQAAAGQVVALESTSDFKIWINTASGQASAMGRITLKDNRSPIPSAQHYRLRSP